MKKSKKARGGKRPGAGMPKGHVTRKTIEKEAARAAVRQMVLEHMKPLVQAQIAHAIGIGHVYTRDKAGKFNKIENQAEIDRLLTEGVEDEHYWIFTKDPSVQAFTDLMNRAIDKPKEQEQELVIRDGDAVLTKLQAARKRLAVHAGQ
jgi:hypothetical protein